MKNASSLKSSDASVGKLKRWSALFTPSVFALFVATHADAGAVGMIGKIVDLRAHQATGCSSLTLRQDNGVSTQFMISNPDILALALQAYTTEKTVNIVYDPTKLDCFSQAPGTIFIQFAKALENTKGVSLDSLFDDTVVLPSE